MTKPRKNPNRFIKTKGDSANKSGCYFFPTIPTSTTFNLFLRREIGNFLDSLTSTSMGFKIFEDWMKSKHINRVNGFKVEC